MARTALGLFESHAWATKVAQEIKALGFASEEVRVLSEPLDMPVATVLSTPGTDFSLALCRDLRQIGATEAETEAYVQGVRNGGALVFATGSGAEVDRAAEMMNRHKAIRVDELIGLEPDLPDAAPGSTACTHDVLTLGGRLGSSGDGARIFVW